MCQQTVTGTPVARVVTGTGLRPFLVAFLLAFPVGVARCSRGCLGNGRFQFSRRCPATSVPRPCGALARVSGRGANASRARPCITGVRSRRPRPGLPRMPPRATWKRLEHLAAFGGSPQHVAQQAPGARGKRGGPDRHVGTRGIRRPAQRPDRSVLPSCSPSASCCGFASSPATAERQL